MKDVKMIRLLCLLLFTLISVENYLFSVNVEDIFQNFDPLSTQAGNEAQAEETSDEKSNENTAESEIEEKSEYLYDENILMLSYNDYFFIKNKFTYTKSSRNPIYLEKITPPPKKS